MINLCGAQFSFTVAGYLETPGFNCVFPVFEAMISLPRSMFPLAVLDVIPVLHLDIIP